MKPAAVLLGLACILMAQGALGKTATNKKAVTAKKTAIVKKTAGAKKVVRAPAPSRAKVVQAKKAPPSAVPVPLPSAPDNAADERELVKMPSPARLALRAEMREQMVALDAVLQRMRDGQVAEAGEIAQIGLGMAVWGKHGKLPKAVQPEQYMPQKMQDLALDGYRAASEFATVALTGDPYTATAMLSQLTGSCAQCHQAYRIR